MKKFYEAPSTEIILLSTKDIITASQNDDTMDDFFDDDVRVNTWFN